MPEAHFFREMLKQHERHMEQRFDAVEARFDRLEDVVRNGAGHTHPDKVSWGAFVTTVVSLGLLVVAIVG